MLLVPSTTAILLAAGTSSRMGATNKMGLSFRGKPILLWAVEALLESEVAEVIVVLGHEEDWAKELLQAKAVQLVVNKNFRQGQLTSIQAGLRAINNTNSDFLIGLADMPLLTAAHYRAVINRHQQMDAPVITLPHNGKLAGHPKLFSPQFRTAILNLEGNAQQGARRVIQDNKEYINRFSTTDLAYFFDVDTPAAYQELLALE